MERQELLIEAYDYFDNNILEMVLSNTVERFCIETEGAFESVEQYLSLLGSDEATSDHDVVFTNMISETFLEEMSSYSTVALMDVYTSEQIYKPAKFGQVDTSQVEPKPTLRPAQNFAPNNDKNLQSYGTKIKLAAGKFGEKLKDLKSRLSTSKFGQAIQKGYTKAKTYVTDKASKVGKAVTSGFAATRFKAMHKLNSVGDKISRSGNRIKTFANAHA